MKIIVLLALTVIITTTCHAQYSRHIVQLTDKGNNSYSLDNPSSFLSQRAIDRRTRYNISIDSLDLPVTQMYVDSISRIPGVKVLSKSKWLNQVLIQSTDAAALAKIQSFPFVKFVKGIGFRTAGIASPVREKFNERIEPVNFANTTAQRTAGDVYNYGNNYRIKG